MLDKKKQQEKLQFPLKRMIVFVLTNNLQNN